MEEEIDRIIYAYSADFHGLAEILLLVEFLALMTNTPWKRKTNRG